MVESRLYMLKKGWKGLLRGCRGILSYRERERLLVWKEGRMGEGVALFLYGEMIE